MKELFLTLISRGLPAIGAVLFNVILIHILDIDAAGSVFYWITNLYFIGFIATLGLDVFLLKKVSTGTISLVSEEKRTAFAVSVLIASIAIAIVESAAVLILASLPFFTQAAINSKILRARGDYFRAGILEQTSIFSISAFVAWICSSVEFFLSVQSVAFIVVMASFAVFALTEAMLGWRYSLLRFNNRSIFHYESSAFTFAISPLITYGTQWLPVYFLSQIGNSEISIYTISVRCASLLAFLALTMDSYLLPKIAKLHADGEHQKINDLIYKFKNLGLLLSVVLGLIYVCIGPLVMASAVGAYYERSYYAAFPIMVMYLLSIVSGPYQSYLLMSGGEYQINLANFMAFSAVVVLCFFLQEIQLLSAGWAAGVILVGRGISVVYMWYCGRRLIAGRLLGA